MSNDILSNIISMNCNIFICLSLFSPIEENTELETKYSNLFDLIERMIAVRINKRPNCEQILNNKSSWALSLDELRGKHTKISSTEIKTIEENFHLYFIQTKLKGGKTKE